jgi:hypothetical protein
MYMLKRVTGPFIGVHSLHNIIIIAQQIPHGLTILFPILAHKNPTIGMLQGFSNATRCPMNCAILWVNGK